MIGKIGMESWEVEKLWKDEEELKQHHPEDLYHAISTLEGEMAQLAHFRHGQKELVSKAIENGHPDIAKQYQNHSFWDKKIAEYQYAVRVLRQAERKLGRKK